jgi:hypothetical protein
MARLRARLLEMKTPQAQTLLFNLDTCGVDWQGRYPCRSPVCPRCRWTNIRKQQVKNREFFAEVPNADLAFATVVLSGSTALDEVAATVATAGYKATRNRVNAGRKASSRLHGLAIRGNYEIDAFAADQLPYIAPERRALLHEIAPVRATEIGPMWVPTYHAIVRLNGLPHQEVQAALSQQWALPNQVMVKLFNEARTAEQNLDRITSYSHKHVCSTTLGRIREPWPVAWTADLYSWLAGRRNAFEFLPFSISPTKISSIDWQDEYIESEVCLLPITVSFSTFSMTY